MHYPKIYSVASWLAILFPLWILVGSAVADIAMSSIAVLFLLHCALTKDWRWTRAPWLRCLLALWVYMCLRGAVADWQLYASDPVLFAANRFEGLRRGGLFLRYFLFAAALESWIFAEARNRARFFRALCLMVPALALDCVWQWFHGTDLLGRPLFHNDAGHVRLTGPYLSQIPGILMAWLYFPACMPLLVDEKGALRARWPLAAGIFCCIFVMLAILLSGERMALLLTLAGWGLLILLLPRFRKLLLLAFLGGLLLLGAVALFQPDVLGRQVQSTIDTLANWWQSPYGLLLSSDLKLAARQPLFGIGANYFRLACPTLYPNASKETLTMLCNIHPHNIYLEWLIEEGVIGFGLFLIFLTLVLKRCAQGWNRLRENPFFLGFLIAFALRLWPLTSSTTFFSPWGAPPYWLAAGMLLAVVKTASAAPRKML